jgi:hemerythrin-like domain-containing protein
MNATQELKAEHEAIGWMLRILDRVAERLQVGERVAPDHLERIVEFLQVFADNCHHAKEEDLLFVAMEEASISRQEGPIAVMLAEHAAGRGYVRSMGQAIAGCRKGDSGAASQFAENARGYIDLLTQHIDKKDHILYPMVDRALSPAEQSELLEGFEEVERERMKSGQVGPVRHEDFHLLLHELDRAYLQDG